MKVTNNMGISLPLAVWLLHDEYDYVQAENYISVTKLMKPIRQIILPGRIDDHAMETDVVDLIPRKLGHAIHDSVERAWATGQHIKALKTLGYPDKVIDRIKVNPTLEEVRASNEIIPVYIEQRAMAQIEGFTLGGKFDMVADGIVQDTKSTSVWGWIKGTRDDEHQLQMSLYRWIDAQQEHRKITEDFGIVNYVFTDYAKAMARTNPDYPDCRIKAKEISLLSLDETENWIRAKLKELLRYWNTPEADLPECTDAELWRSNPVYKFFLDQVKAQLPGAKSTKNFSDLNEARKYQAEKGGRGIIITQPGEVKACGYCAGFMGCTQKDRYL
jgi:hypothetical protein